MRITHLPKLELGAGNVYVDSPKALLDIIERKDLTPWMKADEACKLIGESESNFYRRMESGAVPYRKFNGIKLIPVLELLEQHMAGLSAESRAFAETLERNLTESEVPEDKIAEILGRCREMIGLELNPVSLLGGKGHSEIKA